MDMRLIRFPMFKHEISVLEVGRYIKTLNKDGDKVIQMYPSKNNKLFGSSYREFTRKVRQMPDEEIIKEYGLIQDKKSTLSANERAIIVRCYKILHEGNHENL